MAILNGSRLWADTTLVGSTFDTGIVLGTNDQVFVDSDVYDNLTV